MDIILKDVKIEVITGSGPDTILISAENIKDGSYPFEGPQQLKALVAKNTAKKWIQTNFPETNIHDVRFIAMNNDAQ